MNLSQLPRTRVILLALSLFAGAFAGTRVWAAGVPATSALTYSGTLEAADGSPLVGTHQVQIGFYAAVSGGTPVCQTEASSVALDPHGRFSIGLPETCASAVRGNANLWSEVLVNGSPLGRTKIGAVPYALEAAAATQGALRVNGGNTVAARVCSGSTPVGNTNWSAVDTSTLTTTIDLAPCGFTSAPAVVASLGATGTFVESSGGNDPYDISPSAFRVYVKFTKATTADAANTRNLHINWMATGN
ncbi:MAG: hypothetical protein QM784_32245 [Polyangiaceae bacterium]